MVSMTGFGRAVATVGGRRIVVEVRSVNNRGLDIKVRGRGLAAAAEVEAVRAVRGSCQRGSVQVAIDEDAGEGGAAVSELAPERLAALAVRLEQLRASLGLGGAVDLMTLAAFLRLERERGAGAGPAPIGWPELEPVLAEALAGLAASRAREGAALASDLRGRAATLRGLARELATRLPQSRDAALRRLADRLTAVLGVLRQLPDAAGAVDPGRLAQEAALLADRLDVSEELARLGAHLDRLDELVGPGKSPGLAPASKEGVGRPLEFLLQEIGRELNTLGTKAQDVDISGLVIAGKAELEKIREQAQNIE